MGFGNDDYMDKLEEENKNLKTEIKRKDEAFTFILEECDWEADDRIGDVCKKMLVDKEEE